MHANATMMRLRHHSFAIAIALSIAAHVLLWWVLMRIHVPVEGDSAKFHSGGRSVVTLILNDEPRPLARVDVASVPKPPQTDSPEDLMGEANAKGTGAQPAKGDRPVGVGRVGDPPTPNTAPPGQDGTGGQRGGPQVAVAAATPHMSPAPASPPQLPKQVIELDEEPTVVPRPSPVKEPAPIPPTVPPSKDVAPPPSKTIERIETELGWEFIQIYGLTEASPLLTVNRAPAEWDHLEPAERARLLSRAGVPAVGVRMDVSPSGEILARSNHVFDGYYEQPEETSKAIVDGWLHTGDGGHLEGAYTVVTDRKKDVIITGGENVSSIEVEDCLYQHAAVAEAAVIGIPHDKWGETVLAFIVKRPGTALDVEGAIAHCRSHLAHYKCPTVVEFRDALPRTATGKLQKFKLREPYWANRAKQVS